MRGTHSQDIRQWINGFLLFVPDSDLAICMSKQKLRFIRPFVNVQLFSVVVLHTLWPWLIEENSYNSVLLLKPISFKGLTYCAVRDDLLHLGVVKSVILFICDLSIASDWTDKVILIKGKSYGPTKMPLTGFFVQFSASCSVFTEYMRTILFMKTSRFFFKQKSVF